MRRIWLHDDRSSSQLGLQPESPTVLACEPTVTDASSPCSATGPPPSAAVAAGATTATTTIPSASAAYVAAGGISRRLPVSGTRAKPRAEHAARLARLAPEPAARRTDEDSRSAPG